MQYLKSPRKMIGLIWVTVFLAGCGISTATPTTLPALPPPPSLTPLPPPPPSLPEQPTPPKLVDFVETIQVTPDDQYLDGGFARINYVAARDHFVVTFVGDLAQPAGGCEERGNSYKVYTTDMQETGESGTFACDRYDVGSAMVGNTYYSAAMATQGVLFGWRLLKIDAASWTTLVEQFHPVDTSHEDHGDPLVAFVNGRLDISSGYDAVAAAQEPGPDTPPGTYGSHHNFFSPDLQFEGQMILTAPPHIHGSSMVFVDEVYYLVTANLYDGDVIVAEYDADWNYLGGKTLIRQAHFPTGLVYDGQRFYLAYTDTSQRTDPGFFPVFLNIRLAVFDRGWNLLEDVAVTNYTRDDHVQPGRPWVILHGDRLYVSYDMDTRDPVTDEEQMQGQAFVSVYEVLEDAP